MCVYFFFFFFNDTATTEIYTLSLHDALPISVAGVGEVAVLLVALPARIQEPAAGQDVDRRALRQPGQQADHDRRRRLAAADHAGGLRHPLLQRSLREPVATPVEHARVPFRLAGHADRRSGA